MISAEFSSRIKRSLQALRSGKANLPSFFHDMALFQQALISDPQLTQQMAARRILEFALLQLKAQTPELGQVLDAFYWQGKPSARLSRELAISSATLSRRQNEGISQLAEIIWSAEESATAPIHHERLQEFPLPDFTRTFGLKSILDELVGAVSLEQSNQILLLVGLGGIGKTTVAFELVRRLALTPQFDRFLLVNLPGVVRGQERSPENYWDLAVSALIDRFSPESSMLPLGQREQLVRTTLNQQQCLVVVDNIESTPVVTYLIEQLRKIAGRGRFIVTSRNEPLSHVIVRMTTIQELAPDDARDLLQFQLQEQGVVPQGEELPDKDIGAILAITRGHPQAILLLVSLLRTMSLPDVLATFLDGRSRPLEELYDDIYERAWLRLSDRARLLLMTIYAAAPEGGTAEHLAHISQLTPVDFFSTIQELTRASLIEVRGDINQRTYALHQLTLNYLRTKFDGRD